MKKLLLLFLCFAFILVFTACGQDNATDETGEIGGGGESADSSGDLGSGVTANMISGVVFYDEDSNGIMDSGEGGLEGVIINCNGNSDTTNGSGEYELSTENSTVEISVDETSLDGEYILTTGNSTQTVETSGGTGTASDIGYMSGDSSENFVFSEVLKDGSEFDNYHFILEMTMSGMTTSSELWGMDSNLKFAVEGQVVYYNTAEGTMGVYMEATNQLAVTPITETMEVETPFTLAENVDLQASDYFNYIGTEDLDGKTVYVFENTAAGEFGRYYVWADTGIIIKMESGTGASEASYYFRDLSIGSVTAADMAYPAGAEIIDLSAFGDMGDFT